MRYPSSRKNQSGWTLTELLVVVIILVILASLILPALMRAEERGRRINCVNNLKQIVTANLVYANDDKDGRLSPHERASSHPAFHHNWLWHHGGVSPKMYFCPSTSHRYRPNSARVDPFSGEPYFPDLNAPARDRAKPIGNSYQMLPFYRNMENYWNGNTDYRDNTDAVLKTLDTINNYRHRYDAFSLKDRGTGPSETWLYCDTDHSPTVKSYYPDPENNHGVSGGNVGFCDGSVRWIRREDYVYSHELSQDNNRTRAYPR